MFICIFLFIYIIHNGEEKIKDRKNSNVLMIFLFYF